MWIDLFEIIYSHKFCETKALFGLAHFRAYAIEYFFMYYL